jgi:hypothetical protein
MKTTTSLSEIEGRCWFKMVPSRRGKLFQKHWRKNAESGGNDIMIEEDVDVDESDETE